MVKILIHGDAHYEVSTAAAAAVNVDDVYQEIIQIAADKEVDAVINLGDTCDNNHPRPQTIAAVINNALDLAERGIHVVTLVGNHDLSSKHSHSMTPLEDLHENVSVIEKPSLIDVCGIQILALPYITRQQVVRWTKKRSEQIMKGRTGADKQVIRKALSKLQNPQSYMDSRCESLLKKANSGALVIGHLDIDGSKAGAEDMMLRGGKLRLPKCVRDSDKPVAYIGGHIHKPQIVRSSPWPILVVGSLVHTDFAERHETKGVIILEL